MAPHDYGPDFSAQGLPSMDKVWSWHEKLAAMGTRYTGSPGHVRFTDWLQEQARRHPDAKVGTNARATNGTTANPA